MEVSKLDSSNHAPKAAEENMTASQEHRADMPESLTNPAGDQARSSVPAHECKSAMLKPDEACRLLDPSYLAQAADEAAQAAETASKFAQIADDELRS